MEKISTDFEKEIIPEYGSDVEMRILVGRHAKYDKESGQLNKKGLAGVQKKGSQLKPLGSGKKYLAKSYSSEIPRAQETVKRLIDDINTDRKGKERVRVELGRLDEDIYIGDQDKFMETGIAETEEKTFTTKELASGIAKRLDTFIRMGEKLKTGSRFDLINITHLPHLLSFLKEINLNELEEINPEGKTFLEKIGGRINYLDGFEILVKRQSKDDFNITLKFKDKEIDLPYEKIRDLIDEENKYKDNKKNS